VGRAAGPDPAAFVTGLNMQHPLFLTVAAGALALALPASARDAGPAPLEEVVVTANRSPERLDRVGQQLTVIDAQVLRDAQTPLLTNVLTRTPGVSFSQNGPVGSVAQVYIRGAEPGQTVVLIDGVKLNNPSAPDTAYNFGNLLIPDVSRIEILRGPQSVLWGSQAIGGVINMITAEPQRSFEAEGAAEGGSHAWGMGRASVGGKSDQVSWRASAAYLTTSGISAYDKGTEADGYRNVGASGRSEVTLTETLALDLRAVVSRGRVEFDGFPPPFFTFADTREYGITTDVVGYAGLRLEAFDGRLKNRLAVAYTRTDLKNFDPDQAPDEVTFSSRGRNRRLEYQGTFALTDAWTAVFGAETERSTMRTASPFSAAQSAATLDSGYLQVRGEAAPGLTLNGGLRHDHHSTFGGHTVGQASLAWRPNEGATVLRASWGQGFKAPSLYQLGSEFGNPDLQPEIANGWDAGIEQGLLNGRVQVSAAYFERRTRDQIDFFTCPLLGPAIDPLCIGPGGFGRFGYYANIARTKARGVELAGGADLTRALRLSANYTWLDARNDAPGSVNFGRPLARRPKHQANANLDYHEGPLSAGVAARYSGPRFDDAGGFVRLKSYAVWDIRAAYALTSIIEAYGRVENLFDKRYETIAGYGQLGRTAYAGLRARF
jgi:vitamin B12 transporter